MSINYKKIAQEIATQEVAVTSCEQVLRSAEQNLQEIRISAAGCWPQFIGGCQYPDFELIKNFPPSSILRAYFEHGGIKSKEDLPLYAYGYFDIKELAAIIRALYDMKYAQDSSIITFADLRTVHTGYEDTDRKIISRMNFVIGNEKTLKQYGEYDGFFFETPDIIIPDIGMPCSDTRPKLTSISQLSSDKDHDIGIFIEGEEEKNGIMFRAPGAFAKTTTTISKVYNIFNPYWKRVTSELIDHPSKNIGALLSFPLHSQDNFIAKALMSIVIYKKNKNSLFLSNDEYSMIFYKLFGKYVDVAAYVDENIPKTLKRRKKVE